MMLNKKDYTIKGLKLWLDDYYPITIISDRYGGVYSKASYLAFPESFCFLDKRIDGGDVECMEFWKEYDGFVGRGRCHDDAFYDLIEQITKYVEEHE